MDVLMHIGTERTGTTTIQEFLFLNRETLASHGQLFPRAFGLRNHTCLACYADKPPWPMFTKFTTARSDEERDKLRSDWHEMFYSEVGKGAFSLVLLSNEHLHSNMKSQDQLEALAGLLAGSCDRVTILIYFRRQDRMAVSRYSAGLRAGRLPQGHFDMPGIWPYMYLKSYALWAKVFGENNVSVRVFDKKHFRNGNLIDDFISATGIRVPMDQLARPEELNQSLSADAECLFIALNESCSAGELTLSPPERRTIVLAINREFPGPPRLPSRREARRFYEHFRNDNDELFSRLGWSRDAFSEDFSDYPDEGEPIEPGKLDWARKFLPAFLDRHLNV